MLSGVQPAEMKRIISVLAAVCVLLSLSACTQNMALGDKNNISSTTNADKLQFPYTFTDSAGKKVTLAKKPQKVAVLFSSYAEMWKAAGGAVDITVGESVQRGFAEKDVVLVDSGVGHSSIDLEKLVDEAPDLVIGTADFEIQNSAASYCSSKGIPSAVFKIDNFNDYLTVMRIMCDITGSNENYKTYADDVQNKVNAMLSKVQESLESGKIKAPKILFVRAGSSAKSTKAKNSDDNFVCAMIKQLGGQNIADTDTKLQGTLSIEEIIVKNPDYMFITTMGDENAAKDYMNSQLAANGFKELNCVKNKNYTFLQKNMFHYKPNSRWAEAYKILINILYPELEV